MYRGEGEETSSRSICDEQRDDRLPRDVDICDKDELGGLKTLLQYVTALQGIQLNMCVWGNRVMEACSAAA
jgi:hypothetical protein